MGYLTVALPHAAVFCLTLIVDIFWAKYNINSTDRKPVWAGFWSMMIAMGGTFSVQIWLTNHWVLLDSMAGAFIGTWWAVKHSRDKDKGTITYEHEAQLLVENTHA